MSIEISSERRGRKRTVPAKYREDFVLEKVITKEEDEEEEDTENNLDESEEKVESPQPTVIHVILPHNTSEDDLNSTTDSITQGTSKCAC